MGKINKGESLIVFYLSLVFLIYPLSPLIVKITQVNLIELLIIVIIYIGFKYHLIERFISCNRNIFFPLLFFLSITFISTLLFNSDIKNIEFQIRLIVYLLVFSTVGGSSFNEKNIFLFLRNYLITFVIICILSLLDYYQYLEIPFFNDQSLMIDNNSLVASSVSDLASIYGNRNQFAVFLAIGFVICYQFLIERKIKFYYGFLAIFVIIICVILSFSRGLILSCILFLLTKSLNRFNIKLIILMSVIILSVSELEFLSTAFEILSLRFNSLTEGTFTAGDKWRYISFLETLNELPSHPIGLGWGNFNSQLLDGVKNSHNTFVTILRSGGLIGLSFLIYIISSNYLKFKNLFRNKSLVHLNNIVFILFFYAFTHDILGTLVLYIVLGIIISVSLKKKNK